MPHQSDAEDTLPVGQVTIETTNILRFNSFMSLIRGNARQYPTIGTVTGSAGIGKTIAIQAYWEAQTLQMHTGLPPVVKVKVKPRSTPKALTLDVVAELHDKPRGRNIYELADEAAAAITRNDLQLLIVDEADRLNEDSFDVLRYIHDRTGCPIVVVGLSPILSVINRHEKFSSRVGLRMEFVPLELTEVLDIVLPQLVFPHWAFNPAVEEQREFGAYIWQLVKPSLRRLISLLQTASQRADKAHIPWITKTEIHGALQVTPAVDKRRAESNNDIDLANSLEADSERRHAAKQKKENRRKESI